MKEGYNMYSDMELERIDAEIVRRNRLRKIINAFICAAVFVLSLTALMIKAKYDLATKGNIYLMFGAFTTNGTIFTGFVSLILVLINFHEVRFGTEITKAWLYYIRLSSTASETIIMLTVMAALLPFVPDKPSYDTIDARMTHIYIPLLTIFSFLFNDAPIGRLKPREVIRGMLHLFLYSAVMLTLLGTGLMPWENAEYDFLRGGVRPYLFIAVILIYSFGFLLTWLLSWMNRKIYVLLYRGVVSVTNVKG